MSLDHTGFYTMSEARARRSLPVTRVERCEILLTGRCNFRCGYCRGVGEEQLPERLYRALEITRSRCVRFSGGEPTLVSWLVDAIAYAKCCGAEQVAISTNGSASIETYMRLLLAGVGDFSVSLDACCAEDVDRMARMKKVGQRVLDAISFLSQRAYTTVGVVVTADNQSQLTQTIALAVSLGVRDVRVIPAAGPDATHVGIPNLEITRAMPIYQYRRARAARGLPVRGLGMNDSRRCGLVCDDLAVMGDRHYPCIIYLREGGAAIGRVSPSMMADREAWWRTHDTRDDPICRTNCLDVCVDYNNAHATAHRVESVRLVDMAARISARSRCGA